MTEILHLSSSQSSVVLDICDNDGLHQQQQTHLRNNEIVINCSYDPVHVFGENTERETEEASVLDVLVSLVRRSLIIGCKSEGFSRYSSMEIGVPTNVRHVAHVTFDRFNGFLGLPVEFEPEVPRRPPSASTSVFGVSTDTMHLSFDTRGNSVPTILLMMQNRLYSQGGLQAEGIFRINGENGQEEQIREQLNRGEVAEDIDVHCLAGLIKAWFRELPHGILDSLEPEQVIQAQTEDECTRLINLLPQTEGALLDWAINLMADVAQLESYNKMNARNIAMVFAPNMTQMDDPLTALMYAVQVMNFLKTLIVKTLRERQDSILDPGPTPNLEPFDHNGSHSSLPPVKKVKDHDDMSDVGPGRVDPDKENGPSCRIRSGETSSGNCMVIKKGSRKSNERAVARAGGQLGKSTGSTIVSRLNMRMERIEAWR